LPSLKEQQLLNRLKVKDNLKQEYLAKLLSFDPTPKKIYRNWLIDKFNKKQIRLEDKSKIIEELTLFDELRKTRKGLDIGQLTMTEFRELVTTETPTLSESAKERAHIQELESNGDIEVLLRSKEATIKIPHTHEASCILGRGTKWCTAGRDDEETFEHYRGIGNLYIVTIGSDKYQLHFESKQYMDAMDVECSSEQIKILLELMKGKINSTTFYCKYAKYNGRWGEGSNEEEAISQSPKYSYDYADFVLKKRWGKDTPAEQTISQSPEYAYYYARFVLKERWGVNTPAEQTISQSPYYSHLYAHDILKERWGVNTPAEQTISQSPQWSYNYSRYVLKERWGKDTPAEQTISQSPQYAYSYAKYVLKERWGKDTPAEQAISQSPKYLHWEELYNELDFDD